MGKHRSRRLWWMIPAAALVVLLFFALDVRLRVVHYDVESPRIASPVRMALITDLHSCKYGRDQETLIRAIDAQLPDLILLGGDIFDDQLDDANARSLIVNISGRYPCYYVTGNHEYWSGADRFAAKMQILKDCGVSVLNGQSADISVRGEQIRLCGIDDPDIYHVRSDIPADASEAFMLDQLAKLGADARETACTVLLAHRPEYFAQYRACGFELALCGHAHGGQWRLPGLLNGLFAPNQGLFPRYAGGRYDQDGAVMIVSRGLARESTRVPRIFNRPELVIVDLK